MDDKTVMVERWIANVSTDWTMKPGDATWQYKYCELEQDAKDFIEEVGAAAANPCRVYAVLERAVLHVDADDYHQKRIDVLNAEQNLVREGKLLELSDMPIDMTELSEMQEALAGVGEEVAQ